MQIIRIAVDAKRSLLDVKRSVLDARFEAGEQATLRQFIERDNASKLVSLRRQLACGVEEGRSVHADGKQDVAAEACSGERENYPLQTQLLESAREATDTVRFLDTSGELETEL